MKITSVDVFLLNCGTSAWRPIVCRVNTDEGISGFGEASVGFDTGAPAAYAMIADIAPLVIGMDAMAHEAVWDKLYRTTFWAQAGGTILFSAISAIDTALWDIKGKALGVPLYKLLGGKTSESLRCYASQLQFGWGDNMGRAVTDEELVEACRKAVGEGFDAVKINFITFDDAGGRVGFLRGPIPRQTAKMIERRVDAVRRAVGPDVDIIVENHARTDAVSAAEMCRLLEPYGIMFIEEAVTPLYPPSMKILRESTRIPLAGGERIFSRWSFLNFFTQDTLQIAQPDIGTCGGVSEAKKICDMAHAFDAGIQIHVCGSPISIAASLHLESSIPNFVIHEHHVINRSRMNIELGVRDYAPVRGRLTAPELPGLGQELSEKAMAEASAHCVVTG